MRHRFGNRRGNALIEFTLVGIPLIFVLISIFEISRAMWTYETLAHAVREGTRYAIVHGENCTIAPNACTITVGDVARRIRNAGVGLPVNQVEVTLTSTGGSVNCAPLATCLTNPSRWPETPSDIPGLYLTVSATLRFQSAVAMLWPGAGKGSQFGTFNLPASSREAIVF